MEMTGIVFGLLVLGLLLIAPILAISAFSRVRNIEDGIARRGSGDNLTAEHLSRLEMRIRGLEQAVERLDAQRQSPASAAQPIVPPMQAVPTPAAPPTPPPPPVTRQPLRPAPQEATHTGGWAHVPNHASDRPARTSEAADLENVVAGKWLNYVGITAVLFAVAFFIEYAFQNNWIGPRARISIGIAAGIALMAGSSWLVRRGYEFFAEGLAALGAAVLYLSLWGGWDFYHLFNSGEVFGGMILVTAAMALLALARNSQRLALLALIGGFLTPELCSTGADHEIVLFTYVAILSAGVLALGFHRAWISLLPTALCATEIYFWGWYPTFYRPEKLEVTLLFSAIFFALFAAQPLWNARRDGWLSQTEYGIALGNLCFFLLALRQMLWPNDRWELTSAFVVLGAGHWLVSRALPEPKNDPQSQVFAGGEARPLFVGLALVCLSLAFPARLDGQWLTIAWAVEGLALVWGGVRIASARLRYMGLLLFCVTAVRVIALPLPGGSFCWNARFMTYAVAVACFALACKFARAIASQIGAPEGAAFAVVAVAANLYALIALSIEIWDYIAANGPVGPQQWFAQEVGLSVLWAIYATGLIIAGIARRTAVLRWQALALFAVVVLKVFFYDLSELSLLYRILSFLVLGILLLGVSFLYQQRVFGQKPKTS